MASYGYTFQSGDGVTPTRLNDARTVSDIVNADINASAAIAGTKVSPDFGSQNITTSGQISHNNGTVNARLTSSGGVALLSTTTNHPLAIQTNDSERVRIDTNGNVGIGASPGGLGSTNRLELVTGSGTACRLLMAQTGVTNYSLQIPASTDALSVVYGASTERLRIDASGNVGIGNTPTLNTVSKLFVSGDITRVGGSGGFLLNAYYDSVQNRWEYAGSGTAAAITDAGSGVISLSTTGSTTGNAGDAATMTERLRVTASGAVLIGTSSDVDAPTGSNDGIKLDGSANTITASRDNAATLFLRRRTGDGNVVGFYRDATLVGSVSVTTTATAYNVSSDYRLKENPQPMVGALSRLSQVSPVTFTWKSNGSQGEGFIAHELQAVVPEAVTGEKDAVDAEGNPEYQGVDASKLVPLLVAAVQELSAKVAALEAAQ